jgi:hypothetical protein
MDFGEYVLRINDESGRSLRSELDVEATESGFDIVLHANGGASRGSPGQNPDYIDALETLLARLGNLNANVDGIWVDSKVTSHLPIDQRAVRPSSHAFPIVMRDVVDIRALRLEIRRSVSRIGGRTAGSIGTGNKRIRLSVSSLRASLSAFERAIAGAGTSTGYWLDMTSSTPLGMERSIAVPPGLPVSAGHLLLRAEAGKSLSSIDVLYVDEITAETDLGDEARPGALMARITRIAAAKLVDHNVLTSTGGFETGNATTGWAAIDEVGFRSILEASGISADDLAFPLPLWCDARARRNASAIARVAAPIVRERISRYIERGPIGDRVKAASGYRCQICVALGLSGLGFPRIGDTPYVEAHHVVPVSSLEDDVLGSSNVIAVCANHHRQLHFGSVIVIDEGDHFRFEFPFGHPDVRVRKSSA